MDAVETMAYYRAQVPWHGLGEDVDGNLTPSQMMRAAKLNWKVEKHPTFIDINGDRIDTGKSALVRMSDHKVLDTVTPDWQVRQNEDAAEFFNDFVKEGHMTMETAGSLQGGRLVWFLAKVNESFDMFGGKDKVDSYLLFTNPHKYGWSTSVSWTAIRVVCWNTLTLSLSTTANDRIVRVDHRTNFVAEEVKDVLNISKAKLAKYKEAANFLASRKAQKTDIVEYFCRLFPVKSSLDIPEKEMSRPAQRLQEFLVHQPGVELGEGTWWQPYNAVTYFLDHKRGKSADTRLSSSWYGTNRGLKVKALELAYDMASA